MQRCGATTKRTADPDLALPIAKRAKAVPTACDAEYELKHHEDYPHDIRCAPLHFSSTCFSVPLCVCVERARERILHLLAREPVLRTPACKLTAKKMIVAFR
jgi:hypothetical protein